MNEHLNLPSTITEIQQNEFRKWRDSDFKLILSYLEDKRCVMHIHHPMTGLCRCGHMIKIETVII